jgi:hypothetical protein
LIKLLSKQVTLHEKNITNSENNFFGIKQRKPYLAALLWSSEKPELVITQCDIGTMATLWPQVAAWPNDTREHATYLSDYLRKALACIDSTDNQPVLPQLVKAMIAAINVLIAKFQNTPDMIAVMQAFATV